MWAPPAQAAAWLYVPRSHMCPGTPTPGRREPESWPRKPPALLRAPCVPTPGPSPPLAVPLTQTRPGLSLPQPRAQVAVPRGTRVGSPGRGTRDATCPTCTARTHPMCAQGPARPLALPSPWEASGRKKLPKPRGQAGCCPGRRRPDGAGSGRTLSSRKAVIQQMRPCSSSAHSTRSSFVSCSTLFGF